MQRVLKLVPFKSDPLLLILDVSIILMEALVCIGTGVSGFIWTRPLPLRHLDEFGNGAADSREDLVRLG